MKKSIGIIGGSGALGGYVLTTIGQVGRSIPNLARHVYFSGRSIEKGDIIRLASGAARIKQWGQPIDGYELIHSSVQSVIEHSDILLISIQKEAKLTKDRHAVIERDLPDYLDIALQLRGYEGIVISATGPLGPFCHLGQKASGIASQRFVGLGGVDSLRLECILESYYNLYDLPAGSVNGLALGDHGSPYMFPDLERTTLHEEMYGGSSLAKIFSDKEIDPLDSIALIDRIAEKLQGYPRYEVETWGKVIFGPGTAAINLIQAIAQDGVCPAAVLTPEDGVYLNRLVQFKDGQVAEVFPYPSPLAAHKSVSQKLQEMLGKNRALVRSGEQIIQEKLDEQYPQLHIRLM